MWDRNHPLFWSVQVGRVWGVDLRLSWWLLAAAAIWCVQLGLQVGLTYFAILFLSVLLHEFGHVAGARATGGSAEEIILYPLGGLAVTQPGPGFWPQVLTPAAGPAVNLLICLLSFPGLYAPEMVWTALDLRQFPVRALHADTLATELALLAFVANWFLFAINILPTIPFDCGQIVQAVLARRLPADAVFRVMTTIGVAAGVLLMLGGLLSRWPDLILLGAIVLIINVVQSIQGRMTDYSDDSFMGYDFSQGYTSLERSSGQVSEKEPRLSSWQRWKMNREARRQELAREKQLQDESQLDQLLAKVHGQGIDSLTRAEKKVLERVSLEYRERTKRQSP